MNFLYITETEKLNIAVLKLRMYLETLENKVIGIDTETTGLNPHTDKVRLIQIAAKNFPILIVDCFKISNFAAVNSMFQDTSIKKIFQNAKFDLKFLLSKNIRVKGSIFDTMIASKLIDCGAKVPSSLKDISERYLNFELPKEEQRSDWTLPELSKSQLSYAARDVYILPVLRNKLCVLLKEKGLVNIAKVEFECISAVAEMEYNGIKIDLEKWNKLKEIYTEKKEETRKEVFTELEGKISPDMFGEISVNIDSPAQVLKMLNSMKINVPNTNFNTLARLRSIPIIDKLINYRKVSKAVTSFLEPIPNLMQNGRIYPQYWQMGSAAGRFSCSEPNLQQIPRTFDFRECFIPDTGNSFVIADYSQIELRVAAEIAKDKTMIEAYKAGGDLHKLTASLVSGKEEISKEERQLAKAVNFGLIYGMGAATFVDYAKNSYGVEMSLEEAEEFKTKYFESYKGVAKWHRKTRKEEAKEAVTLLGRKRVFPENEEFFLTTRLNTPVQGTAADILKSALGTLYKEYQGTSVKLIGNIHDEIILECPESKAEEVLHKLQEIMVNANILKEVPLLAEGKICRSWADK